MPQPKSTGPIKLSGRALYDDGQMINSNVINHVTKERLGLIRFQQTCFAYDLLIREVRICEDLANFTELGRS